MRTVELLEEQEGHQEYQGTITSQLEFRISDTEMSRGYFSKKTVRKGKTGRQTAN